MALPFQAKRSKKLNNSSSFVIGSLVPRSVGYQQCAPHFGWTECEISSSLVAVVHLVSVIVAVSAVAITIRHAIGAVPSIWIH